MQFAFRFHHAVNRAVHHEQRHGRHADQQRIRRQQAEKSAGEFAVGVHRHAPRDVAERRADEQARHNAADGKTHVPHLPPPAFGRLLRNSIATARKISAASSSISAR